MSAPDSFIQKLSYLPEDQIEIIKDAVEFATIAHEGQYRRSGEPYVTHPIAVAGIIADMRLDHHAVVSALLHDVIEDTHFTKEDITERYSKVVAEIVDGISKISAIQFESKAEAQAVSFRKMILAMTKDIRVILVKLADRLHNMRTLGVLRREKRKRIAQETLGIYSPIANRLGMNNLRVEYEDLCFQAIYPLRSKRIQQAVKRTRGHRKEIISTVEAAIRKSTESHKIQAKIVGREKHLYSIYSKMRIHRKPFEQIMDVFGFRIVVDSIDECYRCLGLMHQLYPPIPGRFKDYIAIPKSNGYQSIHTTLKGPSGTPIEIQIRTEEMNEVANNGIASHWIYKSNNDFGQDAQRRADSWLASLVEMQKNIGDPMEFVENFKFDLFPEEVYVFTPKGGIFELPYGATAVDFAYAVHTDIGNSCVTVRADDQLIPLSAALESGQTVQIITSPTAIPNPSWLKFVVTGKARSSIKHYLKTQESAESEQLGERLLDKALNAQGASLEAMFEAKIVEVCTLNGCEDLQTLFIQIGLGQRIAPIVARQFVSETSEHRAEPGTPVKPLIIDGTEGLVIRFGKCCYPIPGDEIIGSINRGKGIMIHHQKCPSLIHQLRLKPDEFLPVSWAKDLNEHFPVGLILDMDNHTGQLAQVTQIIADCESNIEDIIMGSRSSGSVATLEIEITVRNRAHLALIMKRLRSTGVVNRIVRRRHEQAA